MGRTAGVFRGESPGGRRKGAQGFAIVRTCRGEWKWPKSRGERATSKLKARGLSPHGDEMHGGRRRFYFLTVLRLRKKRFVEDIEVGRKKPRRQQKSLCDHQCLCVHGITEIFTQSPDREEGRSRGEKTFLELSREGEPNSVNLE